MMVNILLVFIAISNLMISSPFTINNAINNCISNRINMAAMLNEPYKHVNIIQMNNNIDRRDVMKLIPLISIISLSNKANSFDGNKKVVVFGASGYTGGDTIRALLEKNISVVAVTRRAVDIVDREHAKLNSLVIDDLDKKNMVTSIVADVLKPETITGIMKDAESVIFCAASRPKVKVIATPGIDLSKKNMNYKAFDVLEANIPIIAEPSDNVEDIGLVNVAEEAIRSNVKRLIIVSSICAKCQKNDDSSGNGYGEPIDRGFANCDACYKKQTGEERVRILYEKAPNILVILLLDQVCFLQAKEEA